MSFYADNYPKAPVSWGQVKHESYRYGYSSTHCSCWKNMHSGLPIASWWYLKPEHGYIGVEYDNQAWTDDELVALYRIVRQKFIDAGYASLDMPLGLVGVAINLVNSPARDLI